MEYVIKQDKAVIRLDKNDEIFGSILKFATDNHIRAASIQGIGATNNMVIGVFDTNKSEYVKQTVNGDMEILALNGNITQKDGVPYVHLHITCAGDGGVYGGHLFNAYVSLTAEIFVNIYPLELDREYNDSLGINTITFKD